jgi:hypothetical protein
LAGDKEALALWSRFRDFSIKRLEETYKRLNIHFDSYAGEAAVKPEKMEEAFKIMQEKNMLVQDKGAYLCDLEKYKLGKVVIKKAGESRSDGPQLWHWFLTLILLCNLPDVQMEPQSTSPVISVVPLSDTKSTTLTR